MNGLDICAGSGIGSLALKYTIPGYRTICYVENESYCQAVLVARIKDGLLEDAPIWDDVRTFDGTKWRGKVDIVSAGFPCQPFSVAGQRKGETDERNLWPDTIRIIGEVRPRYAFLENVPGLISSGYFETILCDLAKIGYDCEWDIVSAAFVGAPHLRKRLWMLAWDTNGRDGDKGTVSRMAEGEETESAGSRNDVAYPKSVGRRGRSDENGRGRREIQTQRPSAGSQSSVLADTNGERQTDIQGCAATTEIAGKRTLDRPGWWSIEPPVGRVAHGIPCRVDRLKMLGNAWVPQVVRRILRTG